MKKIRAVLLAVSGFALAACSTVSVESQVRVAPDAPALSRTLVVVALPDATRRAAEDALVARLSSLHATASYATVTFRGDVTMAALRDRARQDGFDGLLVVRPDGMTTKVYPQLEEIPSSAQVRVRLAASLTALDGDREIWKGTITNSGSFPLFRHAGETMTALAERLRTDGAAR